ncbi:MAG: phage holin family protein, partial [Bacteroidota bacterium]
MKLLLRWVASAAALLAVAYLIPAVQVESIGTAFVAALVVGLVNATIGAVVKLITTPIRWLTLGLFTLAINAVMFWLATELVDGFSADGALTVLVASLLYGLLAGLIGGLLGANRTKKK